MDDMGNDRLDVYNTGPKITSRGYKVPVTEIAVDCYRIQTTRQNLAALNRRTIDPEARFSFNGNGGKTICDFAVVVRQCQAESLSARLTE
jgi:hypothetical protein